MADSTSMSRPNEEYSRTLSPGQLIMSSKVVPGLNDFILRSLDSIDQHYM
ncbi:MAG TPA: hypothetical protein VK666_15305 [Chryseolinea sp.]|nr:hypothetical protein [Chryseolinea sp.]